jgi:hypothetical protein
MTSVTQLPFTVDGTEIRADAPRSMGMSDENAQRIAEGAETFRETVMHLHADVVDRTATITASNCEPGEILFGFGDGAADVEERVDQGATPTVEHTYASDGVFTAQVIHENGDRATLQIPVNFPAPFPESPEETA